MWLARELRGSQRIALQPRESREVLFELHKDDLAFHNTDVERVTERARSCLWIVSHSQNGLQAEFQVMDGGWQVWGPAVRATCWAWSDPCHAKDTVIHYRQCKWSSRQVSKIWYNSS